MGPRKARQNVGQVDRREILRGTEANRAFNVRFHEPGSGFIGDMQELPCIDQ